MRRPKLAFWLWERDLDFTAAGVMLGRTREWVRRVCLPFDDPRRTIPRREDMQVIVEVTGGEVMPADFYEVIEGEARSAVEVVRP